MTTPRIELLPSRAAVCTDESVTLDVLVRITPALPEVHFPRPRLNLALVLDRSGSMAEGKKWSYAREAAVFVVEQLLPTDRVSVTAFDNYIETVVPVGPAADKPAIVGKINAVKPRGSTDLYGGWSEGGRQVASGLARDGVNRVLLLSDGLANVGMTDPNAITAEARGLAARGVGTTTLGVGDNYNEDLMEALATAGDGNYYYIETPDQLVDLFQTELHGLMATSGLKASLGLEPGAEVKVLDVLNDLETVATNRLKLPNLVVGMPVQVVVRLAVPPRKMSATLLNVRLAWDDPHGAERQFIFERLGGLPAVPKIEWDGMAVDPRVREQVGLLMAARAQKEAGLAHERGDIEGTRHWLAESYNLTTSLPASAATADGLRAIDAMQDALDHDEHAHMRKLAKYHAYRQRSSRPYPPPPNEPPKNVST